MSREMLSLALNENKRHQWNNKSSLQSREGKYSRVVDLPSREGASTATLNLLEKLRTGEVSSKCGSDTEEKPSIRLKYRYSGWCWSVYL